MEIFEAFEKRYSCRNLRPAEISDEDIEKILAAGRSAPSGWNKQPFDFLVVKNRDGIEQIAKSQNFVSGASAVICIIANPDASQYWREDIGAAAENMILAITALGLATTWVQGTILPNENELKEYFDVPKNLRFVIALPIGKAAAQGSQAPKKDLRDMTHWEKW